MTWRVVTGDCLTVMAGMAPASVDAIVTDPPYGIGFMGHEWDQPTHPAVSSGHGGCYDLSPTANRRFQAWCEAWALEVLRVLKPGGHMLVFGGTRTYHRMASGIEDAGFEIRDCLVWLYGSGFPKSLNLDGDHDGWGTALKPGHEPIVMARKPLDGTVAANVLAHGTGALNIEACRIPVSDANYASNASGDRGHAGTRAIGPATSLRVGGARAHNSGRWPANVLLDPEAAVMLDEQSGQLVSGANPTRRGTDKFRDVYGAFPGQAECEPARGADIGGASRFFYCAKTSTAERNAGCDRLPEQQKPTWSSGEANAGTFQSDGTSDSARNPHPTVKPITLMRWLVRLVTPAGGLVLDPFSGSGTTGAAAVLEGAHFTGIERDESYATIAQARIAWWAAQPRGIDLDAALDADRAARFVAASGQGRLL